MNKQWTISFFLLLAGCSHDTERRFLETMIADRSPVTFEVNAVRPIFDCANSPDPRYPCQGIGPEGFVRDLIVKPFANKWVTDIKDDDHKKAYQIRWTWFSMQGTCNNPRGGTWDNSKKYFYSPIAIRNGRSFTFPVSLKDGRLSPGDERNIEETGLTRLSAQNLHEKWPVKNRSERAAWPPQPLCTADYIDLSAGKPFGAALWIYAPEPADKTRIANHSWVKPPEHSNFEIGCREEKRNGLIWNVCLSAGQKWPGGPHGFRETQIERWNAYLGDSGFLISIDGTYTEPLYLWPQWYAERRAALLEVIDSVRFEKLPMPD